jgi:GntR family transcriptional regulator / MocR family aminotransferase
LRGSDLPLEFKYTDGGMNLTGFLPPAADDVSWSARLTAAGFDVPSLSHYSMKATTPGLVFGFTAFTPEVIGASFERMRRVLKQRS